MKPNKRNRLFSPLRTACAAALLLCQPAIADIWQNSDGPVQAAGVDLNKQYCMADAYIKAGGKGMSNTLGESLNCTANDVEITQVIPNNPNEACDLGDTFTFYADVTIRTNAAERWDTTFYLPLNDLSPQVIQGANAQNCSLLIPKPGEEQAANLDGDQCGDIKKSLLTNDQYVLHDEPITMLCADADRDGRADFNYCAAWDNISRNNCDVDDNPVVGQVPNNKSKCNCGKFNINVVVNPNPPTLSKELLSADQANEPEGIFKYRLTITKDAVPADVIIQSLRDIVRSSTDNTVLANFDLNSNTDQTIGNLTLLGSDTDNTCDSDDLALPQTLTTASPTLSCQLVMKIEDEDLPDDGSPELYQDFIRATATRVDGTTAVGNDQCDPTDDDPNNNAGNCTNVVTVKMANVNPVLEITKEAESGPGLHKIGDVWFIEASGNVTYVVTITNNSTVDAVLLTSLTDTAIADLLKDNTGSPACSLADGMTLAKDGGSFTCRYVANVSLGQGQTYTNTVEVGGKDNEDRPASDVASESVTLGTPSIVLSKEVAAVNGSDPNTVMDADFGEETSVNEPGGMVVYRFTITNNNSVTEEDLTLSDFIDDVLFASPRATKSSTQRADECIFTTTIAYGTPYVCTLVADVTGNALDPDPETEVNEGRLVNTAEVKATTPQNTEVTSNEDLATVNFDDVPPSIEGGFALKATVFLNVKNKSLEKIYLKSLRILGMTVRNAANLPGNFAIANEGGSFGSFNLLACVEPADLDEHPTYTLSLDPDADYSCAFSVEFAPNFTPSQFNQFTSSITSGDAVVVEFADEEGSKASAEASVVIDTTP